MKRWTVGDLMTDTVVTVVEDAPYRETIDTLAHHGVSAVPIVDGTVDRRSTVPMAVRLVGCVTGVVDVVSHLTYRYDDTRVTVGAS